LDEAACTYGILGFETGFTCFWSRVTDTTVTGRTADTSVAKEARADSSEVGYDWCPGFVVRDADPAHDFRIRHLVGVFLRAIDLVVDASVCVHPPRCRTWEGKRCGRKKRMGFVGLCRRKRRCRFNYRACCYERRCREWRLLCGVVGLRGDEVGSVRVAWHPCMQREAIPHQKG